MLTVPLGTEVVAIVSAGLIVTVRSLVAAVVRLSVTSAVNVNAPDPVGVPDSRPAESTEPRAVIPKCSNYSVRFRQRNSTAGDRRSPPRRRRGELVVTASGSVIVMDSGARAVDVSVPVTFTTKLNTSATVGVPEIAPVEALSAKLGGSAPESMAQAVAPPPPLEERVCE